MTVLPNQRLRVRADGNIYAMLADGGTRLCIAVGASGAVEIVGEAVPFVQRLLVEREFIARDCLRWSADGTPHEWGDVERLLTKLKTDGLIEDVVR
jgi:hypothetical protein